MQDLRYALRTLVRTPGFTTVVVLTLALGIGANTAIFTLLDQVVLRRLSVPEPDALVQLDGPGAFSGRTELGRAFSYPMYRDLRDAAGGSFAALIARAPVTGILRLGTQAEGELITAELLSGNAFAALGATPVLGRLFGSADDVAGAPPVVVLSHAYWSQRLGASTTVVGTTVVVNATPMTVIGVAPPGFTGIVTNELPALFAPVTQVAAYRPTWNDIENRRFRWLHLIARLAPGVSVDQAKTAMDVRYRRINEYELTAVPAFAQASQRFKTAFVAKTLTFDDASRGISEVRGTFGTPMAVLMGMVGLVLLIACANVANLMLARATGRQREMGVRIALGAARGRLLRQTLVESAVVAAAGGLLGTILAIWLGDVLLGVLPLDSLNAALTTVPDLRVALFTASVTCATVVLFGLAPAFGGSFVDVQRALKADAAGASGSAGHARVRKTLVIAQVALSTLLVAGAALFARSLDNLRTLGPGFDTSQVVSFALNPSLTGRSIEATKRFYEMLIVELRTIPGVAAISASSEAVLTSNVAARTVEVQGYEASQGEDLNPWTNEVGSMYFATMGIALVAGRDFTDRDVDGAPRVAVVNQSFAKYFFGDQNPIGRRFGFRSERDPGRWEIVGVVKDTAYSQIRPGESDNLAELAPGRDLPTTGAPRVVYTPFAQSEELTQLTFYLRTSAGVGAVPAALREAVRRVDAGMPVYRVTTLAATVDASLAVERVLALVSTLFAGLATLLAAIGLYGVMSYTVSKRTREIGLRIALGAERVDVVRMVLRDVTWMTGLGIVVGLPGAYAAGRIAESQLFGLTPLDPLSLAGAATVLSLVGLVAGYLPARRAAATEPMRALRLE